MLTLFSSSFYNPKAKCRVILNSELCGHSKMVFKLWLGIQYFTGSIHFPFVVYLGGLEGKASACNAGDLGSIPESGRSPGEGNGTPLQYSCLENPMDGGAWEAAVHGIPKSQTWLSNFTFLSLSLAPDQKRKKLTFYVPYIRFLFIDGSH